MSLVEKLKHSTVRVEYANIKVLVHSLKYCHIVKTICSLFLSVGRPCSDRMVNHTQKLSGMCFNTLLKIYVCDKDFAKKNLHKRIF